MPVIYTLQGSPGRVALCSGHWHLAGDFIILPFYVARAESYGSCAACDAGLPAQSDDTEDEDHCSE